MKVGSAQEKSVWVLTLKEWTNGTHAVPNGIPTRTNGSLAVSHGSLLPANGGLLSRHGSVSVHKVGGLADNTCGYDWERGWGGYGRGGRAYVPLNLARLGNVMTFHTEVLVYS